MGRAILMLLVPVLAAGQVIDVVKSPQAKVRPVPVRQVKITGGMWAERMRVNVDRSIPTMLDLLEEHGIVDNFRRLAGKKDTPRKGPLYTDSDLYKWMEAAAWAMESTPRPELKARMEALIGIVLAAQEPSGYLNTYYVEEREKLRFTEMQRSHELYCLGHLLQAGIAWYRTTGDRRLMDGGMRFADYLSENFGPSKRPLLTGHPELEMALVELYRVTGQRKYLDLAGYLLSGVERERLKLRESDLRYMFSGKPFTSRTIFEGHAVRAMYAASGATDYYLETGDPAYRETLERLWQDMRNRKMYLTGGVGSRSAGEAFGEAYELPNEQAYTESCAAIANLMWNFRLLALTGDARYTDVIERALYNGINSGMSLDGTMYCYRNPLASSGEKIRNPWYDTTCCPPNLQRLFASLPGYLYGESEDGWYVHLYAESEMNWHKLSLRQKTSYPSDGRVNLMVDPETPKEFTLYLRIPEWSTRTLVGINGRRATEVPRQGTYLALRRTWKKGDTVTLAFDMQPRLVAANPRVPEDFGRAAVERGPLVYCLEQHDQPDGVAVSDVLLSSGKPFNTSRDEKLLGGTLTILHQGMTYSKPLADAPLYAAPAAFLAQRPVSLTFIPYYAWANRGPAPMQVWIPVTR